MSDSQHKTKVGKWAEEVVRRFYCYDKANIFQDKKGTDGFWQAKSIQIKGDLKMAASYQFYKEMFEKTYPEQEWRKSPNDASIMINVTDGFLIQATSAHIHESISANHLRMVQIKPTSMGYLIPFGLLKHKKQNHGYFYPSLIEREIEPQISTPEESLYDFRKRFEPGGDLFKWGRGKK